MKNTCAVEISRNIEVNKRYLNFKDKIWNQWDIKCIYKKSEFKQGLHGHICESWKQIEYYGLEYQMHWFLDPIGIYLLPNSELLIRFTLQSFLAYPLIIYFNRFWDKSIGTPQDPKLQKSIRDVLIRGLACSYVGPALACWAKYTLPSIFDGLTHCLITNMLKSATAYHFFHSASNTESFLSILPLIFASGAIGGAIFFYASLMLENSGFNGKDVFYLSMMTRKLFDPQIKKLEGLTINQLLMLLMRNFSAA